MSRERLLNGALLLALIVIPGWALYADEPFTITLATRAVIFALAAVGLNIALGLGGLVSLGHAVFFGIGGYAMGILASHAQSYTPLIEWPFAIEGTKSMPVIWLVAIVASSAAALLIGLLSLRTSGVYFIMITLAFGQMMYFFAISWPAYGGEDGLGNELASEQSAADLKGFASREYLAELLHPERFASSKFFGKFYRF